MSTVEYNWPPVAVTGSFPLAPGAATSANQTNGNQKTQIVDGSGNVIGSTSNALNVALTAGSVTLINGVVSTANSSTTPLGVAASFIGTAEDMTNYCAVNVVVATDRSGTLNLQFSSNGTNWDQDEAFAITPTTPGTAQGFFFAVAPEAKYFRVKYDNDGTIQGVFRLQTIYKVNAGVGDVQDLTTVPVDASNGMVTKSVIYGKTTGGGGGYVAVKTTPSGALNVAATQDTSPWVVSSVVEGSVAAGTAGTKSALIGGVYNSSAPTLTTGQQVALQVTSGGLLKTSAAVATNANGNSPGSSTVSTVTTLTAPANTVGFILMNLDTSTASIRYRIGATATSTSGQQLQPGRDTGYIPCAANISICAESGTQNYDIQWILL